MVQESFFGAGEMAQTVKVLKQTVGQQKSASTKITPKEEAAEVI